MSRHCMITGKGPMSGNNVSHALNRTRRRFMPNIQDARLYSEILDCWVSVKASAQWLRTVEHNGGLDAFLSKTATTKLNPKLRPYKAQIEKAKAAKA
jgi:large subunit ribosomal protein L28